MRVAVIFFLTLCFYLSGASHVTYAAAGTCKTPLVATRTIEDARHLLAVKADQDLYISTDEMWEETDYLIGVEDDEDDLVRKHLLPASHYLAFYYTYISNHFGLHPVDRFSLYEPPSYSGSSKYITLRVLRL